MKKKFNIRLKELMESKNLRPIDLAEKSGIAKSAISQYLSGTYVPKQDNIHKLARALRVSPSDLLGLNDDEGSVEEGQGLNENDIKIIARRLRTDFVPEDAEAIHKALDILKSMKRNSTT